MKITFVKEVIESKKKGQTFYAVRLVLVNEKNEIISKCKDVSLWLTKEQYDSLKI